MDETVFLGMIAYDYHAQVVCGQSISNVIQRIQTRIWIKFEQKLTYSLMVDLPLGFMAVYRCWRLILLLCTRDMNIWHTSIWREKDINNAWYTRETTLSSPFRSLVPVKHRYIVILVHRPDEFPVLYTMLYE